jgi:hypothetical protein
VALVRNRYDDLGEVALSLKNEAGVCVKWLGEHALQTFDHFVEVTVVL